MLVDSKEEVASDSGSMPTPMMVESGCFVLFALSSPTNVSVVLLFLRSFRVLGFNECSLMYECKEG